MSEGYTKGSWDYVGDVFVGVIGDCDCEPSKTHLNMDFAAGVVWPDRPHESHSIVVPIEEEDLPEGMTMEQHIANCKLIAASPELLEACKQLIASYESVGGVGDPEITSAYLKAIGVVKKARGETA